MCKILKNIFETHFTKHVLVCQNSMGDNSFQEHAVWFLPNPEKNQHILRGIHIQMKKQHYYAYTDRDYIREWYHCTCQYPKTYNSEWII